MILVIGGTGRIGGEVLRLLAKQGVTARALVRDPAKAQQHPGITWVAGDLSKPETLRRPFAGAKVLFLVSSIGEDMVAVQQNAIEAAGAAGLEHIVKLSAFGASAHSKAPICLWHYQIEKQMEASGMKWTCIRPHHFMENLLLQADYVKNEGAIYALSGDGKIPYVDSRDIAAVAAATLTTPGHHGKKYVVTGREAFSYREATGIIARAIGKKLRFVDETREQARARRTREGYPPAIIESALAIAAYQRAGGKTVTITTTVADLTGRPPRTLEAFVLEHADAFRG
jgi:uncharacterized protein YbjT (DUF2867 family)